VEECADTLAFASEPVLASLANILAYKEQLVNTLAAQSGPMGKQNPPTTSHHRSPFVKEYELLELEIKYGLLQVRKREVEGGTTDKRFPGDRLLRGFWKYLIIFYLYKNHRI